MKPESKKISEKRKNQTKDDKNSSFDLSLLTKVLDEKAALLTTTKKKDSFDLTSMSEALSSVNCKSNKPKRRVFSQTTNSRFMDSVFGDIDFKFMISLSVERRAHVWERLMALSNKMEPSNEDFLGTVNLPMSNSEDIPSRLQGKNVARLVCCVLGVGSLVAWNAMLTITDYYYQVFPKYHPSRVLTIVYQLVANVFIITLASKEAKLNTRFRNIFGYSVYTAGTFCLIILDLATHGSGSVGAYVVLCLIVAVFGLADAFVQGAMVGDLSFMCPEFIQAFMGGLGIAGALTSGLRLITKAIFNNSSDGLRKGALLFIGISTLIELMCVFLYTFVFTKLPIVKYYRAKAGKEGAKTVTADLAAAGLQEQAHQVQQMDDSKIQRLTKKELLQQNIDLGINLFLIYVVTLSIFPGFLYENTGEHRLGDWYAPVLIAMYNVWDSIARFIPSIKWLATESRKWITICVLARLLLIPAFYFTAKYADQGWMIFLTSFLGLSNGYLTVCIFSIAPKGYNGPEANALGNLMCVFLLGGIFVGVCLGWLWLIGHDSF